jgi:hypothetical protein
MKARLVHGFSPRAVHAACTISELAAKERMNVTVNLFATPQMCLRCARPAEVFVGSKKLCATCWSSSLVQNKIRQLSGKRTR